MKYGLGACLLLEHTAEKEMSSELKIMGYKMGVIYLVIRQVFLSETISKI